MKLFFDLETIQTQKQEFIDDIAKTISHPKTMKKAETIEKWEKDHKQSAINEAISKTVFDGGMGEIITFGCAFNDAPAFSIQRDSEMTEADLLNKVNEDVLGVMDFQPLWVGHNICGFDLRYLWKRFIVNNIKPEIKIPYDSRPWGNDVFDTMFEWSGTGSDKKSMEFVCKAMGIKGKGDMDGSKVYQSWIDKEYALIARYCEDDVERTREMYRRMTC